MPLLPDDMAAELKSYLDLLPEHVREGLDRYFRHGIRPGGFLQAVLSNDLADASRRADDVCKLYIARFPGVFDLAVPADSWGSRARMEAWIERGRHTRLETPPAPVCRCSHTAYQHPQHPSGGFPCRAFGCQCPEYRVLAGGGGAVDVICR